MKIICEAIFFTLVHSAFLLIVFRCQGALKQVYNYPPAIIKCVTELGLVSDAELAKNAKVNKTAGIVVMLALMLGIIYFYNGERSCLPTFLQLYIFINVFSLFGALVINGHVDKITDLRRELLTALGSKTVEN